MIIKMDGKGKEKWIIFTKNDLFDALFSRKFTQFKNIFPKECEKFQITENDHEKAKKIIENSISEGFYHYHYLNSLDSDEITKFINKIQKMENTIETMKSSEKGKDLIQKEKLFLQEYFFDIEKQWKFSVESIKLKIIEKILQKQSQVEYKWKEFGTNDQNLKLYTYTKVLGSGSFGKVYLKDSL